MVLLEVGIDTQRAGTWGRIMVLVRVGVDTQRAGVLGKVHISVGGGDSESHKIS